MFKHEDAERPGLRLEGSQRAYDMYLKSQFIIEKRTCRGQGPRFATGTPVSNNRLEKYHMMRYWMPRQMLSSASRASTPGPTPSRQSNRSGCRRPAPTAIRPPNRMKQLRQRARVLLFDQVADTVTMDDIKAAYKERATARSSRSRLAQGRPAHAGVAGQVAGPDRLHGGHHARRARVVEQRRGPPRRARTTSW